MISRKFAYADDLALLHSSGNWKDLEETLSQDMSTLSGYLQTWRLKLSHTKTMTAVFHLNNREAKRDPRQLGLSSTACGLVLGDSIRPCTNGISFLHRLRVWRLRANRRPCSNSVPYTSGTTWSTRSDGFG